MAASRFFEWFQFAVLGCWGLLGVSRAVLLRARGVHVMRVDKQRTLLQKAVDALALTCLLVWAYENIAYAWRFRFHIGSASLGHVLVENISVKIVGAALVSTAVLLYALALRDLGASWRLGLDRSAPGPLITGGTYRWMRHPIYVAFDLLFLGTFLVQGRLIFLVLASIWLPLLHAIMEREERFLIQLYGEAYRDYCSRVGRYFSWSGDQPKPNVL